MINFVKWEMKAGGNRQKHYTLTISEYCIKLRFNGLKLRFIGYFKGIDHPKTKIVYNVYSSPMLAPCYQMVRWVTARKWDAGL